MENYAYYVDRYCDNRPLIGYGIQFKQYLDEALSGNTVDISKISEELKEVDEHLTDVIINVEGNLAGVAQQVQTNLAGVMVNVESNLSCQMSNSTVSINSNIENSKEEIIEKIAEIECIGGGVTKEDLDMAVTAINWHSDENRNVIINNAESNKEEIVTSVIANKEDAVVRITATVQTESEKAKERLEQIRIELIDAINKTGQLVELGFTDLNEQIISSTDEIIDEIRDNNGLPITGGDVEEGEIIEDNISLPITGNDVEQ